MILIIKDHRSNRRALFLWGVRPHPCLDIIEENREAASRVLRLTPHYEILPIRQEL
jgi:hypothetical protein